MSRQIIDNALPENDFSVMESVFMGDEFPWYFANYSTTGTPKESLGVMKDYKFHHVLYRNYGPTSSLTSTIEPVLKLIDPIMLLTCRLFLTTYTGEKLNQGFHTDHQGNRNSDAEGYRHVKTAILYINTNNGGTLFEDGEFVESVKNRLVIFKADQRHAAITATNVAARVVLNINYL